MASECLRALVSASWIMREPCVPVSPNGAEGTCSPTSRLISGLWAIVRLRLTRAPYYLGEGPIFFIFEAQVVDHLAQTLSAASDCVDRCLQLLPRRRVLGLDSPNPDGCIGSIALPPRAGEL